MSTFGIKGIKLDSFYAKNSKLRPEEDRLYGYGGKKKKKKKRK